MKDTADALKGRQTLKIIGEKLNNQISELTEEVWSIYEAECGNHTRSSFSDADIPLTAICELPAIACHHTNFNDAVNFFLSRYNVDQSTQAIAADTVKNILNFEYSVSSSIAKDFLTRCAKLHLEMWTDMHKGLHKRPSLPKCTGHTPTFLDLASGPEFVNFFTEIEPTTTYFAVDLSFFAIECLRLKAEAEGVVNVFVLQKDIMKLTRADIPASGIEVIRAKNIFTYVPLYLSSFPNHLNWLADDGRFVFAEQASRKEANNTFIHPLVKQNLNHFVSNGWGFTYSFGNMSNPLDLNNVTLLKTREGTVANNLQELDNFYLELAEKYGNE